MKVVVSGGGTAGHINPALALAEVLAGRGCEVHYAGTPGSIEERLVEREGIPFASFEASGFNRNHPLSIVRALHLVAASTSKARQWFSQLGPERVVCFGGYVCIPVGRAALSGQVPLVVHEQNSLMGMANRYLSRKAQAVALTYVEAADALADRSRVVVTGNPVRSQVLQASRNEGRAYCGVGESQRLLVVFGGSQGARHVNAGVVACKNELMARPDVHVRHIAGPKEADAVVEALALEGDQARRWQVVGYEDQMGKVLAAADLVVSRSGATSLAEISALRVPALLVPYPYATADHQTLNARSYVERGAAVMVSDNEVETQGFVSTLLGLLDDAGARARMREAAESLDTRDAAQKLADVVIGAGA